MIDEIKHEGVEVIQTPKTVKKLPKTTVVNVVNTSTNDLPKYTSTGAAGMDIRAYCINENFVGDGADWDEISQCVRIFPGGRALIHTGIYLEIPKGYECQVRSRSGLALKNGIMVLNSPGTIDSDYRGEIGVILMNLSNEDFEVRTGDRIAQLVVSKVEQVTLEEVDELNNTERGTGGFGHSGTN